MKNNSKRFLSLLLALVMVLGMMPAGHVHAEEEMVLAKELVTTVGEGENYVICLAGTGNALTNQAGSTGWGTHTLATSGATSIDETNMWTLEAADGGYKLKNVSGYVILERNAAYFAGEGQEGHVFTFAYTEGAGWTIKSNSNNEYFNNLGSSGSIGGWLADGTKFDIYKVVEKSIDEVDPWGKRFWTKVSVDTETVYDANEGLFEYAWDRNPGSIWHSNWQGASDKLTGENTFTGVIDFNKTHTINYFSFTPRLSGNLSGIITQASLYVKENEDDEWTQVAANAAFAEDRTEKVISFEKRSVRYVKFVAEASNDGWVAVSEFDIGYEAPAHEHSYTAVVTEPTCTEGGCTTYTCECGDSYVADETEALGHDYVGVETAPSFGSDGYTTYTCSRCSDSYVAYDEGTQLIAVAEVDGVKYATLAEAIAVGGTVYVLADCALTEAVTIDKTVSIRAENPVTITTNGVVDALTVVGDGRLYLYENVTVISDTAILYANGGSIYVNGATVQCTTGTYALGVAANEGYISVQSGLVTSVDNALVARDNSEVAVWGGTVETTSTGENIVAVYACNGGVLNLEDGGTVNGSVGAASSGSVYIRPGSTINGFVKAYGNADAYLNISGGEINGVVEVYDDATVYVSGGTFVNDVTKYCLDGYHTVINEAGKYVYGAHSYESETTAPTCTADGSTVYTCACGDTYSESVPATGHTEETIPAVEATCTETGLTEGKKCSVCGEILVAQEEIPALGHTEATLAGFEATCTTDGLTDGTYCSVCDETLVAQETIPALGHDYVDGICTVCGEEDPDYVPEVEVIASGWSGYTTWELTSDGTLTFSPTENTLNGQCNLKNYCKVNGVLTLPWSEFAEMITKVVIEDGIHDIGQMAFYELPNLAVVELGADVTEIRGYAFKNCTSLTTINLGGVDNIRQGAFYGCSALENLEFAEGVVIEAWAFTRTPYASLNP